MPVTATIDNYATAAFQQVSGLGELSQTGTHYVLNLGTFAVGSGDVLDTLDVANAARADAPADWLVGTLTASASPGINDTGLGSGTLLAGATTPLAVDLSTANAGVFTQTITLAVADGNASGFSEALAGETVTVTGTVLSAAVLAEPIINNGTKIVLPDAHVVAGTPDDQTTLSIRNAGVAGLDAAASQVTGAVYASGSIGNLAPGATDTSSIVVGVTNTADGAKSGTVTLSLQSAGSDVPSLTGGNGNVTLPSQTITVTGNVYNEAAPSVTAPSNVVLHVGDDGGTATEALTVANTAPADAYSENLLAAVTGAVTGSLLGAAGSTTGVAAGASDAGSLTVRLSTKAAGTDSGSVGVVLSSDGTGIDTLGTTPLGTIAVQVAATIDNYATAAIQQTSGSGVLSQTGTTYELNLGSYAAGTGEVLAGLDVTNAAPTDGPADWLSGTLTASSNAAFSDPGAGGSIGTLGAGGTTPFSIALSTANAGVFTQTLTLAATDFNASGYSEALAGETIVVTGTVLSAAQLAKPVINTATPIELPDAHVATGGRPDDQTTISISNTGSAVLSASVSSTTGDAYANGSIIQLAAGATDTTDIVAGVNNTSAGFKTGVVTLADSSGVSPGVTLTPQTFGVSGKVFNEAAASITAPANVYLHVGDGGGQQQVALTAANTAPSGPVSERLDATVLGVVNGAAATASGSVAEISAGSSNGSSLKVKVSTATAATISATVAVQTTSDGTGVDTLGTTSLGTVDVPVTITVDNYATAAFEAISGAVSIARSGSVFTLDLGTVVAGQALTADAGLFNTAAGPADWITGSLAARGNAAFSNSGTGAFSAVGAGGDAGLDISLSTGTAGVYAETIVFAGTDGNPSGFSQAMGGETLVVTGTVEARSTGTINTASPIDFGNVRLGSTRTEALSISNTAPAGSALLDAFGGGATGAASESGGVIQLAPGATNDTGLVAALNTGSAGLQTGTVYVNYQADAGAGAVAYLGGGSVVVEGVVYREAAPVLTAPATLYLHAGDSVSEALTVANAAANDGYSEALDASLTGVTGALTSGSGSAAVAAGGSDTTDLSVLINAGSAGVYTGTATVALASDGTGIDGLGTVSLGSTAVAIAYDVDNYATASVVRIGGDGSLSSMNRDNHVYTLNLGSTEQYSTALYADLEALNAAAGPVADQLDGSFTASGDGEYANSGLAGFSGISFGNADTAPVITLNTGTIGTFTETIVLHPTGTNASGYSGTLAAETIDVVGTITAVPPPPPAPLPVANAYGDVHITTFDGLYYNFQAEGEFVLAQSTVAGDSFQIQARLQPWSAGSTVSVITMLAAEVGTDRVTIALDRSDAVWINGAAATFGAIGDSISLSGGGSITEVSSTDYQVTWGTGEVMNVTLGGSYINTSLTLAATDTPGTIQGLWGSDTGQANDFRLADGTVLAQPLDSATLYGAYADAWRVTGGTSLMDYLAGQTTTTFTDKNFPAELGRREQPAGGDPCGGAAGSHPGRHNRPEPAAGGDHRPAGDGRPDGAAERPERHPDRRRHRCGGDQHAAGSGAGARRHCCRDQCHRSRGRHDDRHLHRLSDQCDRHRHGDRLDGGGAERHLPGHDRAGRHPAVRLRGDPCRPDQRQLHRHPAGRRAGGDTVKQPVGQDQLDQRRSGVRPDGADRGGQLPAGRRQPGDPATVAAVRRRHVLRQQRRLRAGSRQPGGGADLAAGPLRYRQPGAGAVRLPGRHASATAAPAASPSTATSR